MAGIALDSGPSFASNTVWNRDSAASRCIHNGQGKATGDDILEHVMDGDYGKAWRDWCDKTQSDRDPVTGENRNGSDINSTDRN